MSSDYYDDYYRAWLIVIDLFQDFQDGYFPSSSEIGVLLRGRAPHIAKKNAILRNQRKITLH